MSEMTTERERLAAIMSDGEWYSLADLEWELRFRYGAIHLATSISARLREMKNKYHMPVEKDRASRNLWLYRIAQVSSRLSLGKASETNGGASAARACPVAPSSEVTP